MKQLHALFRALTFPILYLILQQTTGRAAHAILTCVKRAQDPGLSPELLQNRVTAAFEANVTWFSIIAALLLLVVLVISYRQNGGRLTQRVRFRPFPTGKTLGLLLGTGVGLYFCLMGLLALIPFPESWNAEHSDSISRLSGSGRLAEVLFVLLLAPIVEEILYRGIALPMLREGFSPYLAVLWQAVIFGAVHGSRLQLVYAFAAGLVLGYIYLRTGSVTAAILVHMVFNGMSFLLSLLEWFNGKALDGGPLFWVVTGLAASFLVCFSLWGLHLRLKKPD